MARSLLITRAADSDGMPLDAFISSWQGNTFRHIPSDAHYNVLDFSRAGLQTNNRWNFPGEPTLYLAADREVAIAEFARHMMSGRPSAVLGGVLQRRLYRLQLRLDLMLDLCQPVTWELLSLSSAPECFLDKSVARATAQFIRVTTSARAIRVPSVAFLDDLTRWSLVVFLEKLPDNPSLFITECVADDVFSIAADS